MTTFVGPGAEASKGSLDPKRGQGIQGTRGGGQGDRLPLLKQERTRDSLRHRGGKSMPSAADDFCLNECEGIAGCGRGCAGEQSSWGQGAGGQLVTRGRHLTSISASMVYNPREIIPSFCLHVCLSFSCLTIFRTVRSNTCLRTVSPPKTGKNKGKNQVNM